MLNNILIVIYCMLALGLTWIGALAARDAWRESHRTEGCEFYGDVALVCTCAVMAIVAGFTVKTLLAC